MTKIDLGLTGIIVWDPENRPLGQISEYTLDEERGEIVMKISLNEHGKSFVKKNENIRTKIYPKGVEMGVRSS